jgi:hypothetical protein
MFGRAIDEQPLVRRDQSRQLVLGQSPLRVDSRRRGVVGGRAAIGVHSPSLLGALDCLEVPCEKGIQGCHRFAFALFRLGQTCIRAGQCRPQGRFLAAVLQ